MKKLMKIIKNVTHTRSMTRVAIMFLFALVIITGIAASSAIMNAAYACQNNRDCNGRAGGPYCVGGSCSECRNNSDCNNPNHVCNANHNCVAPPQEPQCPAPVTNDPNGGGACNTNSDCIAYNRPDRDFCINNRCEYCRTSSDCHSGQVCNANYHCVVQPPSWCAQPLPPAPVNPDPVNPGPVNPPPYYDAYYTPPPTYGAFSGCVFLDDNKNGIKDPTEKDYSGAINVLLRDWNGYPYPQEIWYNGACYTVANFPFGSYSIELTRVPNGYTSTPPQTTSYQAAIWNNQCYVFSPKNITPQCTFLGSTYTFITNLNFGISSPVQTGSISGCVFIDTDADGIKDPGEIYSDPVQIKINPPIAPLNTTSPGCFSFSNLPADRYYTLQYYPPPGYIPTFPITYNQYGINLSTSSSCSVSPQNTVFGQPSCTNGVVTNANFGITNAVPWYQTMGFNIRDELSGITDKIPNTSVCETVASRDWTGGTPGIIYSGNLSNNFGQGTASSKNWIVSGEGSGYGAANMKTSYATMLKTLKNNGIATPTPLTCTSSSCTITDTITSNPYITTGDLTLNSVLLTNKKVVLFVNGDLKINGPITVSPGAFFMVVVNGNIIVNQNVGANVGTYACPGTAVTQLQGIFSADKSIQLPSTLDCPAVDKQLNVAGAFIMNAGGTGSGNMLVNDRSLCATNRQYPSLTMQPRLDFLLNAPEYIMRVPSKWLEVAP